MTDKMRERVRELVDRLKDDQFVNVDAGTLRGMFADLYSLEREQGPPISQREADNAAAHDLKVRQDFAERVIEFMNDAGMIVTYMDKPKVSARDHIRQLASEQGQ